MLVSYQEFNYPYVNCEPLTQEKMVHKVFLWLTFNL